MGLDFTQLVATPRPMKIGDREYRFSPFRVAEWVAFESWIHERYAEATKRAFADLSDEAKERAAARLAEILPTITPQSPEGQKIARTPEGACRMIWLSLRIEHPDLTIEEVDRTIYDPRCNLQIVMDFIESLNEQHLPRPETPKFNPATRKKKRGKRRRR